MDFGQMQTFGLQHTCVKLIWIKISKIMWREKRLKLKEDDVTLT